MAKKAPRFDYEILHYSYSWLINEPSVMVEDRYYCSPPSTFLLPKKKLYFDRCCQLLYFKHTHINTVRLPTPNKQSKKNLTNSFSNISKTQTLDLIKWPWFLTIRPIIRWWTDIFMFIRIQLTYICSFILNTTSYTNCILQFNDHNKVITSHLHNFSNVWFTK